MPLLKIGNSYFERGSIQAVEFAPADSYESRGQIVRVHLLGAVCVPVSVSPSALAELRDALDAEAAAPRP